ncbi:MAG: hemolysin family protein [Nostocoides sp.]
MIAVLVTLLLLLANAFFVGAEFAAMAARRSQLEPLAAGGSRRAVQVLTAMEQLGSVLVTAQLGITVCSVLLGAYSEAALHHSLIPVLEGAGIPGGVAEGIALVLALLIVIYFHVVVGEMIPKNLALAGPDRAALILVPPLLWLTRALRVVISFMEWFAKAVVSAMGIEPRDEVASEYTAGQVAHIVEESWRQGLVQGEEAGRLGAALEFSDKSAVDVAVPLEGLVTIDASTTPDEIESLVAKRGFSRFPVVDVAGVPYGYLHLKDILYADQQQRSEPVPPKRIRRLATVASADGVELALESMRRSGAHLARVVNGAGSVTGVVFLEDVIEELVGEVTDTTQRQGPR